LKEENSGKVPNRILYVVSLNHATNDATVALLPTLFPVVLSLFKISLFQLGILVALMYLTNVVCQLITGHYSEKFEPRILLPLGISIMALSMVFLILSSSFEELLFSGILLRLGSSFFHPVGVSTISRTYSGEQLDSSMGFQSAFGNFGIFIVFLITAPIYYAFGWSAPFLLFLILDLLVVAITMLKLGKVQKSKKEVTEPQGKRGNFLSLLPSFFVVSTFITGGASAIVTNYGNVLLERAFNVTDADLLIGVWIGCSFFGALYTGRLTRVISRSKLLVSVYSFSCVSMLALALAPGSLLIVGPSLVLNGFSLAMTYPIIYSELSSFLGDKSDKKGSAFGMIFSTQIIGSSVIGFVSGYISGIFGLSFPFEIVSALLFVAAIYTTFWIRRPTLRVV
jgi:MFS family permease